MIGAEEKRRLIKQLGNDCSSPIGAVLKSLAGVLVLTIIAAGPWTLLSSGRHSASQENLAARTAAEQERSKLVVDADRRDREIERNRILGEQDSSEADRTLDRIPSERMQDRSIIKAE